MLLAGAPFADAVDRLGAAAVKHAIHRAQDSARRGEIAPEAVAHTAAGLLPTTATTLTSVLNATGVVVHTNLGRAPLSAAAVAALSTAAGYVDVEYDTETGTRARRGRATLAALLAAVPAAEDAHVVNNGAAALALAAAALAAGREIIVSRGELIEIGDGFRLPDLLISTGARLREVGTTNRTVVADYAHACGPDTAFILKIHPSNFRVEGFTHAVPVHELTGLGVPVVGDIGSGLLARDPLLPDEPNAADWLGQGAALVTASGDKLLGGPQAGLLLGSTGLITQLRRHPFARALRPDKLALAALEATLTGPRTPVTQAVHADPTWLRARVDAAVHELTGLGVDARTVPSTGLVGGGGAPGVSLEGWAVRLDERYAAALRRGSPSVVGRVEHGACLLDLRCVPAEDDARLLSAVAAAAKNFDHDEDSTCE